MSKTFTVKTNNTFKFSAVVDSDTWLLQGALVVTRHGDRGPLTHLKNGDKLPCDAHPPSPLLKRYYYIDLLLYAYKDIFCPKRKLRYSLMQS